MGELSCSVSAFVLEDKTKLVLFIIYVTIEGSISTQKNTMQYDATTGSIKTKGFVGDAISYQGQGKPPHAVSSIAKVPSLMDETPQNITYTDFNKVKQISQGNKSYTLTYGVDRQRIKSVSKTANTTTKTKYYLGNYEEEHLSNGKIRKLHYIYTSSATAGVSGSDLKAVYVENSGKDTLYYTHTDYQGNLIKVTDEKGKVMEQYAYDPWGLRRNPSVWHEPDTRKSFLFDRGYTLHEHLSSFGGAGGGLINMNGRVYDPLLAQFLSPDPYIQAPSNWLNYNRYAYGFNNPLMFSDPDGEYVWIAFALYGAWTMGIKAGVAAEQNGGDFWKDGFWKGAVVGFATGAIGGSGIAPFGTQWIGTTTWGAIVGTASYAGNVWAMGGDNYNNIWQGTLTGGVMGFMASEQFGNLINEKGFVSNNQVLKNFELGKYGVSEGSTWQQDALDYFGFKGTYEPTNELFRGGGEPGIVHPKTGDIFYNKNAFENFDKLHFTADHEYWHHKRVVSGRYSKSGNTISKEEYLNWTRNYKNQGLYIDHGFEDIGMRINSYGTDAKISPDIYFKYSFDQPRWHYIYKIPRRW